MNKIAVGGVVGCNRAVVRRDLPGAVERFLGLVKSNPDIIIRRQKLFKKVNKQRFFFFFFFFLFLTVINIPFVVACNN